MRKEIYLIISGLFLLTLVIAQLVGNIIPAVFTIPERAEPIRYEGNITFKVDGKEYSCYLNEPNMNIDDDFEYDCLSKYSGRITDVIDWTGRKYEEVTLGDTTYRSFDRAYLEKLRKDYEEYLILIGK